MFSGFWYHITLIDYNKRNENYAYCKIKLIIRFLIAKKNKIIDQKISETYGQNAVSDIIARRL